MIPDLRNEGAHHELIRDHVGIGDALIRGGRWRRLVLCRRLRADLLLKIKYDHGEGGSKMTATAVKFRSR